MKKYYKFLFPLVAMVTMTMPRNMQAQIMLVVADGAASNSYVPVNGHHADAYLLADFVYPASSLGEMDGGVINSMTFYSNSSSVSWGVASFTVSLKEISNVALNAFATANGFTEVYSGSLSIAANGLMTVDFDTPYTYGGGNLLVRVQSNVKGSHVSCSWLGITSSCGSFQGYSNIGLAYILGSACVFLPKVKFNYAPGSDDYCFLVSDLEVQDLTYNGCTLTWTDTLNTGATYTVYNMADTTVLGTTSSTSFALSGLMEKTDYRFGVVTNCDSGMVSGFTCIDILTPCSGAFVPIPYSDDFEFAASDGMPSCWVAVSSGTGNSGTFPSSRQNSYNAYSNSGYFQFESTTGETEVAALPVMGNISDLKLSFWASAQSYYLPVFEVGVMEDSTFVTVDTIDLVTSDSWGEGYHRYVVLFNDYGGNGDRIALRTTGTTGSRYILMLDDVEVLYAATPEIVSMPALLNVSTNTDIVVTASVVGDIYSSTYSWTSTMADASLANMMSDDSVLTLFYFSTGVDTVALVVSNSYGADTAYTVVYVRDLTPVTMLPYSTGFEEFDDVNWTFTDGDVNTWVIGTAVNNTAGGTAALYISNDGGATNDYLTNRPTDSYAIRYFQLDEEGEYELSFDWRCAGEVGAASIRDYMDAYVAPDTTDFFSGTIIRSDWTDLTGRLAGQSSWQHASGTFFITTPGVYPVVFHWQNDASAGNAPAAAVDNIVLYRRTCPAVTDLVVDNISSTGATLHWRPTGSEFEWRVLVGEAAYVVLFDTTLAVTGLEADTDYAVAVYAVCGEGDTSFAATATFHTRCSGIDLLPWSENFEGMADGITPACWTVLGGSPCAVQSVSNAHGGSKYLQFGGSASSNMIVLPSFNAPINTLQVRLWTRPAGFNSDYYGSFSVGYMTDLDDVSTFVPLQTYNYSDFNGYEEKEVPMNAAPANAEVIVFWHHTASSLYYWYVDDVVVEVIPACPHPLSISAVATSDTSVAVDITGVNDNAVYRIYWSDGTTVDSVDVAGGSYTITGLAPSTYYSVSAVTVCDDRSVTTSVDTHVRTWCVSNCDVVIRMEDRYGDGWNGNAILGYIDNQSFSVSGDNNVFRATLANGYSGTFTYGLCEDETLVFIWKRGSYANETSFDISNGGNGFSGTGSSYATGDTIGIISGCPTCLRPTDLVIDAVDTQRIDFHWTPVGSESQWEVSLNGMVVATVGTTSYSATGLNHGTTYTVGVRAVCDNDNTSQYLTSTVMTPISFSTLVLNTGFETEEEWHLANGNQTNRWTVGTATHHGGSHALYISDDFGANNLYSTSSISLVYAYKTISFDTPGDYAVTFDWRSEGKTGSDFLRVFLAPANVNLVGGYAFDVGHIFLPSGWIALDGGSELIRSAGWRQQVAFFHLDAALDYHLVFFWRNNLFDGVQPPAAIDNVRLGLLSCPTPGGVTVNDITATTATVAWNATHAGDYELEYGREGFLQGSGSLRTLSTASAELTGLEASTTYDLYVRSLCGGGVTSPWSVKHTFTTPEEGVGIDDVEIGSMVLFPNPASMTVTVSGIEGLSTVTVVDLNGRVVFCDQVGANGHTGEWRVESGELTIDVSTYAKGAYFVRITGERTTSVRKLVVR